MSLLKESITDPEKQTVYVIHADCGRDETDMIVGLVKKEIRCKDVYVLCIGPIIGASVGPDTIGVMAFGKEVTFRAGDKK